MKKINTGFIQTCHLFLIISLLFFKTPEIAKYIIYFSSCLFSVLWTLNRIFKYEIDKIIFREN